MFGYARKAPFAKAQDQGVCSVCHLLHCQLSSYLSEIDEASLRQERPKPRLHVPYHKALFHKSSILICRLLAKHRRTQNRENLAVCATVFVRTSCMCVCVCVCLSVLVSNHVPLFFLFILPVRTHTHEQDGRSPHTPTLEVLGDDALARLEAADGAHSLPGSLGKRVRRNVGYHRKEKGTDMKKEVNKRTTHNERKWNGGTHPIGAIIALIQSRQEHYLLQCRNRLPVGRGRECRTSEDG